VVELSFLLGDQHIQLHGRTTASPTFTLHEGRFGLSRQILRAITDHHDFVMVNGSLEVLLTCLVDTNPDGA
jgi:hypothetical protein